MSRFGRLAIALVIFLSGAALTPFISLPAEAFGWEEYAGAYGPIHLPIIIKSIK